MKLSLHRWLRATALVASCHLALPAMANMNTCYWRAGVAGPMDFQADVGNVYVPRDARIGSVIGVIDQYLFALPPGNQYLDCSNDGTVTLNFSARPIAPSDRRVHEIDGQDASGKVFMTNIPGVGVRIRLASPFDGVATNSFIPTGGNSVVPFDGTNSISLLIPITVRSLGHYVTLVKTGPIAPGSHSLSRQIFEGHFSGVGLGFRYGVKGTVMQAQCAVGANPVSADPVPLGDWNTSDFTHRGFTTDPTDFTITLSSCEADPTNANQANAHIRLDGAKGSVPDGDGSQGVFTLSSGSTAAGMGIQILRSDGITPVPLGTDVSFGAIEDGVNKELKFKAQYYQIDDSSQVNAGKAEGSLGFTITFQ